MENSGQPKDIVEIRELLNVVFDDVELDAFCLAHYPKVYDKFGRGMRKDQKTTLLLDHCRRQRGGLERLVNLVATWQSPAPAVRHRPILLQRPPRTEHFIGREQELAQLLEGLQPGRVVTLCGPGGIGKTALASEAIWTLAPGEEPPERFPDGIIFYSFYDRPDVALACEHIVRSYDEAARDTSPAAVQRLLSRKRALLVLDGTEEASDLRTVLEARGACGVLVTSRTTADAVVDWQDLPPLPTTQAVELLQAWGGERAADETACQRICELVGGLPLAVRLAGFYLARRQQQAATYLSWLQASPLRALSYGQRREQSMPMLLERSVAQVSTAAQQALALVGALALAPFSGAAIAAAFEIPVFEAENLLGELVSYGFLLRPDARYAVSHALVHTYARERLDVCDEILDRLVAYYVQLSEIEGEQGLASYRWLILERGHLMQVLTARVKRGEWDTRRHLVRVAHLVGRKKKPVYEGRLLWYLSYVWDAKGDWQLAIDECRHYEKSAKPPLSALLAIRIGGLYMRGGRDYDQAEEWLLRSLEELRESKERLWELAAASDLTNVYRATGQYDRAIELADFYVERYKNWKGLLSSILFQLGLLLYRLGWSYEWRSRYDTTSADYREAPKYYEWSIEIGQELGSPYFYSRPQAVIAYLHALNKEWELAEECARGAVAIHSKGLDVRVQSLTIRQLGAVLLVAGKHERSTEKLECARKKFEEALAIARDIDDKPGIAHTLLFLADCERALGKVTESQEACDEAQRLINETGHRGLETLRDALGLEPSSGAQDREDLGNTA